MFIIPNYPVAVICCVITMLCWGSWANTQKLAAGTWRFELFYWDYVLGILLLSLVFAFTLGSNGIGGRSFMEDIRQADTNNIFSAFIGGIIFNAANILLVAAIAIAGMAVAFPVGIGLALVIGVVWNYAINPTGNKELLFGGMAIIVAAIIVDALAYRSYALQRSRQAAREGKARQVRKSMSTKGIILSLVAGVLMGSFFPLLQNGMASEIGLGPY